MNSKLLLSAVFMAVAVSAAVFLSIIAPFMPGGAAEEAGGEKEPVIVLPGPAKSIPFLTDLEICNPEIARKYGVKGYLEIGLNDKYANKLRKSSDGLRFIVSVKGGGETRIPLVLRFVSYFENVTEIEVVLDPMGTESMGYFIEETLRNGSTVLINRYVKYETSGIIKVKHNQSVEVVMIVSIPENFPLSMFNLGAVGITIRDPLGRQLPLGYFIIDRVSLEAVTI